MYHYNHKDQYLTMLENIDVLFSELQQAVISENGMNMELDFNEELYLESFSTQDKLAYILKQLES